MATPYSGVSSAQIIAEAKEKERKKKGTPEHEFAEVFGAASAEYAIPVEVLDAVAKQESNYNQYAKSGAGAEGMFQFMPATAKEHGVNPWNVESSARGAAKYLAKLLDRFDGDWEKAFAAYNWGPTRLARHIAEHGDDWLNVKNNKGKYIVPEETRNYVKALSPIATKAAAPLATTASLNPQQAEPDAIPQATQRPVSTEFGAMPPLPDPSNPPPRAPYSGSGMVPDYVTPVTARKEFLLSGAGRGPSSSQIIEEAKEMPSFTPPAGIAQGEGGFGSLLSLGVKDIAKGVVGLIEMVTPDIVPTAAARRAIQSSIESELERLDPKMRKLVESLWFSTGENSVWRNPQAMLVQLVRQVPMLFATAGTAGIAGKIAAKGVATAAGVGRAGPTIGRAYPGLTSKVAVDAAKAAGGKAGAAAEGALITGLTKTQIAEEIEGTDFETLRQLPIWDSLVTATGSEEAARAKLARDTGRAESLTAGAFGAGFGAVSGRFFGGLFGGERRPKLTGAGARAGAAELGRRFGKGFTIEGGTEGPQEAFEQLMSNVGALAADPTRNIWEGVAESWAAGTGLGGLAGGTISVAAGSGSDAAPKAEGEEEEAPPAPPPAAPAPTAPEPTAPPKPAKKKQAKKPKPAPAAPETDEERVRAGYEAMTPDQLETAANALQVDYEGKPKEQLIEELMVKAGVKPKEPPAAPAPAAPAPAPEPEAAPERVPLGKAPTRKRVNTFRAKNSKNVKSFVRALTGLRGALANRFPDAEIPRLTNRMSSTQSLADFLVGVDEKLGDQLEGFTDLVNTALEGKGQDAINAVNRLTSEVNREAQPGIAAKPGTSLQQLNKVYQDVKARESKLGRIPYRRKSKTTGKQVVMGDQLRGDKLKAVYLLGDLANALWQVSRTNNLPLSEEANNILDLVLGKIDEKRDGERAGGWRDKADVAQDQPQYQFDKEKQKGKVRKRKATLSRVTKPTLTKQLDVLYAEAERLGQELPQPVETKPKKQQAKKEAVEKKKGKEQKAKKQPLRTKRVPKEEAFKKAYETASKNRARYEAMPYEEVNYNASTAGIRVYNIKEARAYTKEELIDALIADMEGDSLRAMGYSVGVNWEQFIKEYEAWKKKQAESVKEEAPKKKQAKKVSKERERRKVRMKIYDLFKKHTGQKLYRKLETRKITEINKILGAFGIAEGIGSKATKGMRVRKLIEHLEKFGIEPAAKEEAAPEVVEQVEKKVEAQEQAEEAPAEEAPAEETGKWKQAKAVSGGPRGISNWLQDLQLPGVIASAQDVRDTLFPDFNEDKWRWVQGFANGLSGETRIEFEQLLNKLVGFRVGDQRRIKREPIADDRAPEVYAEMRTFMDARNVPGPMRTAVIDMASQLHEATKVVNEASETEAEVTETEVAGEYTEEVRFSDLDEQLERELGYDQDYDTFEDDYEARQQLSSKWTSVEAIYGDLLNRRYARNGLYMKFMKRLQRYVDQNRKGTDLVRMPNEVMFNVLKAYYKDSPVLPLVNHLESLGLDVPIFLTDDNKYYPRPSTPGVFQLNEDKPLQRRIALRTPLMFVTQVNADFMAVALHELVHAATVISLRTRNNAITVKYLDRLREEASNNFFQYAWENKLTKQEIENLQYYLQNNDEFIAGAFTSDRFQAFLASTKLPMEGGRVISFMRAIVQSVMDLLGISHEQENVLAAVINVTGERLFWTEQQQKEAVTGGSVQFGATSFGAIGNPPVGRILDQSGKKTAGWMETLRKGNNAFMNYDTMERKYRELFDLVKGALNIPEEAPNPLTRFVKAVQRVTATVRQLADKGTDFFDRLYAMDETERMEVFSIAMDSTLANRGRGIYADQPLWKNQASRVPDTESGNYYLVQYGKKKDKTRGQAYVRESLQKEYDALRARYKQLSPAAKAMYKEWYGLNRKLLEENRAAVIRHVQRVFNLNTAQKKMLLQGKTKEDFKKIVADPLFDKDADGNDMDLKMRGALNRTVERMYRFSQIRGPYFRIGRPGNYIVASNNEDNQYMATFATKAEADEHRQQLISAGKFTANELVSTERRASFTPPKMVNQFLADLKGIVPLDEDVQARLENAVVELMAHNPYYESSLGRKAIKGAHVRDMGVSGENYMKAALFSITNIESAYDTQRALADFKKLQRSSTDLDQSIRDAVNPVISEIAKRNRIGLMSEDPGKFERTVGTLGFLNFLGAPSFWLLNATQTAVITVPVLAAERNLTMLQSYRLVKAGWKAVRKAADGPGLLDAGKLADNFADKRFGAIVRQLMEDNVIDSTFAHEFGDLNRTQIKTLKEMVKFLEKQPQKIEHFNRIATAYAAYQDGASYQQIVDLVQMTQFNYSAANRARLLKYLPGFLGGEGGGGKQIVSPIMMFKMFGIEMTRLFYGNLITYMKGKYRLLRDPNLSAEERSKIEKDIRRARRTVGGLMFTHTLFGGLSGGLGIGLAQTIMAAINAMLDDEDKLEPEKIMREFLDYYTNAYVSDILMKGAPAALGADMSRSINLGNLLFMTPETNWADAGGFERTVYSFGGPIAQYGAGGARTFSRWVAGEVSALQMLEALAPVKLASSILQATRMNIEGLNTRAGQMYLQPGEVGLWDTLVTASGLQSTTKTRRQAEFYQTRGQDFRLERRKRRLMREYYEAKTPRAKARVRRKIDRFNATMRERRAYKLVIGQKNLLQSAKSREEQQAKYAAGIYSDY